MFDGDELLPGQRVVLIADVGDAGVDLASYINTYIIYIYIYIHLYISLSLSLSFSVCIYIYIYIYIHREMYILRYIDRYRVGS